MLLQKNKNALNKASLCFLCGGFYCFRSKEKNHVQPGNLPTPSQRCSTVKVKFPLHLIMEEAGRTGCKSKDLWVHSRPQPAQRQTQRRSTGNMNIQSVWAWNRVGRFGSGKLKEWRKNGDKRKREKKWNYKCSWRNPGQRQWVKLPVKGRAD